MMSLQLSIGYAQLRRLRREERGLRLEYGEVIDQRIVKRKIVQGEPKRFHVLEIDQPRRTQENDRASLRVHHHFASQPQTVRPDLENESA